MGLSSRAEYAELRRVLFGAISGVYVTVGTKVGNAPVAVTLINNTDADLVLSVNGAEDHQDFPAGISIVLDLSSNTVNEKGLYFEKGTQFYIKSLSALPTSGYFSLSYIYGSAD